MLRIAEEVRDALDEGRPVVALESTIIAHGLPFPRNLEVARALERTVRDAGAVPATIAVLAGMPCVGLDTRALDRLARRGDDFAKSGAGDLAVYVARRRDAATTVGATALLAARAGIRLFATGGIGGVHRGDAGDISNDLDVLSTTPVAVVSAGAKAILDLSRTLEHLETLGVPVVGYRTAELPAFYTRESGFALEHRADQPEELAEILRVRFDELGQGGVLIANPIAEDAALDAARIHAVIERAIADSRRLGIAGKRLTPFLLAAIAEATGGDAVAANQALATGNARLAAEVACAYSRLRSRPSGHLTDPT